MLPASSEEDQLNIITKLLGNPSQKLVNKIENEKNKDFVQQLPKREGRDFEQLFKGANPDAIDLLKKMLTYDPDDRITVQQGLEHPYLKQLHYPEDEPTTNPVSAFDFDFEKYSLSKEDFKDLMYDEIMLYHSDEAALKYVKAREENPGGALHLKYSHRLRRAFQAGDAA